MSKGGKSPKTLGKSLWRVLRMGLEVHVIFPVVVVALLSVIWTATLSLCELERASSHRDATVETRELLGTYEAQVVRSLHEIDQTLRLIKHSYEQDHEANPLPALKASALLPPDVVFTVEIVDAAGRVMASAPQRAKRSVAAEDYFASLRNDTDDLLAIGRPANGPTANRKLQFARRLNKPDGTFSGAAVVSVDAAYFVSGYEPAKLGNDGVLGLAGVDGVFRVRRSGNRLFSGDQVTFEKLVPDDQDDDVKVTLLLNPWDRVRRYTSARQLYEFPLAVVVGLSEREQLAQAVAQTDAYRQRAVFGSVFVMALGAFMWRMSWQLTQARRREAQVKIEHARRVEYLAYHDGLTTLPNRGLFSKLLGQCLALAQRHNKQLAVAFLDLDRFKQINDTLGHEAGDQLLQEVARRVRSCVRESDTVARLGGDEFVVLLPELRSQADAATVAQKILTAIAQPFELLGQELRVTCSIGISTFPLGGTDEQSLTKTADIAMYHAKELGKNNFQFYSEELNASSLERLTLESSLRHALERDEFALHYQPKRDSGTGQITGMEALLRWQHPDLGVIAPLRFLTIAEETGLILPIGKWVLETACRQNVLWQIQGLPRMSIAVNLTARQFADENLPAQITEILHATGMDAALLELEISESLLMRDVSRTLIILSRLKAIGVRIAVDDFGTGISTLAVLQRLPIDVVKIDRSFIGELALANGNSRLTDAIISLGRALSLTVVAQGVETRDQADFLREHSCDELQGFFFTKPIPAAEATQLIHSQLLDLSVPNLRSSSGVSQ
jgi:diguanylate cyclase (GGDEF)-like protein